MRHYIFVDTHGEDVMLSIEVEGVVVHWQVVNTRGKEKVLLPDIAAGKLRLESPSQNRFVVYPPEI